VLDLPALNASLSASGSIAANNVVWFDKIGSTNDYLLSRQHFHGCVCLAGIQTEGRGRRGRQWGAPYGSSVLMSIGWQIDLSRTPGLSLVCGLAVQRVLDRLGVGNVSLKWPNDVLLHNRKVAGILVELVADKCVVGLGLNVNFGEEKPDVLLDSVIPWTDLSSSGYKIEYTTLVEDLIVTFCQSLEQFSCSGFGPFVDRWNHYHGFHGKRVQLTGGQTASGIVVGVNESGALILDTADGRSEFYSGDVSMSPSLQTGVLST
jgi:BirA family biotin operon repressor/biotin-[acetyl-CoA-carboxylase] ligase